MNDQSSGIIDKIRQKMPVRTLRYVPGDCFFTKTLPLPDDFDPKEIDSFAELTIEGLAPFPIEQLCWGYLTFPNEKRVLVFAAFRPRVEKRLDEPLEDIYFVAPDFVFLCKEKATAPTVRIIESPEALTAVALSPGNRIPDVIRSVRLEGTEEEPIDIDQEKNKLLAQPVFNKYRSHVEYYSAQDIINGDHGVPTLVAATPDGVVNLETPVRGLAMWDVDLHDDEVRASRRKEEKQGARMWQAFQLAGCLLILLLLLQIGLWVFRYVDKTLMEKAENQAPAVQQIEENASLQEKLDQFSRKELRPFDMLGVINPPEVRPGAIEYDRVRSRGLQEIEIEGEGTSIEMVNRFADNMRKLSVVSRVTNDVRVRSGKASFRLNIVFTDEFATPQPLSPDEAAQADTASPSVLEPDSVESEIIQQTEEALNPAQEATEEQP